MKKNTRCLSWIIAIILLIAALAYFTGIGKESLWLDEAMSVRFSQGSLRTIFRLLSDDDHLPLYFLVLWGWIKIFGTSEIAARSLSAVFGLLAVFLIYLVGRKLVNERTGLFAAALLAVSPFFTYHAQNARMYTMSGFLCLMSVYFYAKLIEKRDIRSAVPYIIFSALMFYVHPFSALVLVVENAHFTVCLIRERTKKKIHELFSWICIQGAIVILLVPGLLMLSKNLTNFSYVSWIVPPSASDVFWTFADFSGSSAALIACVMLLLVSFAAGHFSNRLEERYSCNYLLVILWVFLPLLLVFAFSLFLKSMYVTRYFIPSFMGYMIWLAWLIQKTSRRRLVQAGILLLFVLLSVSQLTANYSKVDNEDVRALSAYLAETVSKGDIILVVPFYQQNALAYYYSPDCLKSPDMNGCNYLTKNMISLNYSSRCCDSSTLLTGRAESSLGDYANSPMWMVSIKNEVYDSNNSIFKYLNATKVLKSTRAFPGGILLFRFE